MRGEESVVEKKGGGGMYLYPAGLLDRNRHKEKEFQDMEIQYAVREANSTIITISYYRAT